MLSDVLVAVAGDWPRFARQLGAGARQTVLRQLAAAVHTHNWQPDELVRALLSEIPAEDPAWDALKHQTTRLKFEEPALLMQSALALRWIIETSPEALGEYDSPEAVEQAAEERLFTAPMISVTPDLPSDGVVVLERWQDIWAPAFQFDSEVKVLDDVATINRILEAEIDPWGAASWWLLPHATLGAIPADAMSLGGSDEVLAAAGAAGDLP